LIARAMKTPPPNFQKIAAAALGCFDQIMQLLGLSGKRSGREFLPRNPNRVDSKPGSFSINTESGAWADFAADVKGGDLISLAAYIRGGSNSEAAVWLAEVLNLPTAAGPAKPAPRAQAAAAGAEWVSPAPYDAPRLPAGHMRHGKPSQVWTYRDAGGRVLFHHCRFDPPAQRKQFSPLTLWRDPSGRLYWAWKWPPAGAVLPLYGLPLLAEKSAAPVIVTEGEKAADAAMLLFPDHAVCTWAGGANAVGKADISPLAGRECWLWPDNDVPGRQAMDKLAVRLQEVGATVKRFNLGALAPLEAGDDAADLLARGWAAERLRALLDAGDLLEAASVAPAKVAKQQSGEADGHSKFEMRMKGLYRNSEKGPFYVCPPFEVSAKGSDPEAAGWGLLLSLHDPDGRPHYVSVPYRMLRGDGAAALELLMDRGFVPRKGCDGFLVEYLREVETDKRAKWVNCNGWHGNDPATAVYVTPSQAYGAKAGDLWLLESDGPRVNPFKTRGTLDDWRENVASLCVNNSRLAFAVSMAFAAPLLFPLGMESGGFSLVGKSSGGKTTALKVGASVCGLNYEDRLRATDNGLEGVFLAKCDAPAFLDELGQLGPQVAGEAVYMAANGSQKARANRTGGARDRASWRTLFLVTSEVSLAAHMGEAGRAPKAGQQARLADIPADADCGLGVFEDLHDYASGHEFAQALTREAASYCGTPFAAFLDRLMRERGESLWRNLREDIRQFERDHLKDAAAGGQARRVATRFGLVAAAGELATDWLELPWPKGEATRAAAKLFTAWLDARGGAGDQEERAALAQVRDFLGRHGEARFTDWDRPAADTDKHAPRVINRAGFRRITKESEQRAITNGRTVEVPPGSGNTRTEADPSYYETEFFIFPEVWKGEICKGHDPSAVAHLLAKCGALKKSDGDEGRLTRSLSLPGEGKRRVYHITPEIWSGER
jgi:uncharacterized protein (DUF927 family)